DLRDLHSFPTRRSSDLGRERFAWLKINRPVFHLYQHIVAECSIQWFELIKGLLGAVFGFILIIYKRTPHHDATMRFYSIGQHVRSEEHTSELQSRENLV